MKVADGCLATGSWPVEQEQTQNYYHLWKPNWAQNRRSPTVRLQRLRLKFHHQKRNENRGQKSEFNLNEFLVIRRNSATQSPGVHTSCATRFPLPCLLSAHKALPPTHACSLEATPPCVTWSLPGTLQKNPACIDTPTPRTPDPLRQPNLSTLLRH